MSAFSGKPGAITSPDVSTPKAFGAGIPLNAISNSQMKLRVEKTAFQSPERSETRNPKLATGRVRPTGGLEARNSSRFDHSPRRAVALAKADSLSVIRSLFRISIFGFRICRSVLLLALLAVSWQFSTSAQAATITPDDSAYSLVTASSSIDGIDFIASLSEDTQSSPDRNDSPTSPDSPADLDDSDSGFDGLSEDTSTRNYQDTPLFSVTDLDAATLSTPGIIRIPLLAVHSFYCLHEHIRERAPPTVS